MSDCAICERVRLAGAGRNPHVIRELRHSWLVLGDHQFFPGYSLVLLKDHARELHDLPLAAQQELFAEVMLAGRAVHAAFKPWKMNYSCYGNLDPHVHWHVFPRYESDPERTMPPFHHAARFKDRPGTEAERADARRRIDQALDRLLKEEKPR